MHAVENDKCWSGERAIQLADTVFDKKSSDDEYWVRNVLK